MNCSVLYSVLVACCAWLVHASSSSRFTNVYSTADFEGVLQTDKFPSFAVTAMELDEDFRRRCSGYRITSESIVHILSDYFLTNDPLPEIIRKVESAKRTFFQFCGMELKYVMPENCYNRYQAEYAAAFESENVKFINNYKVIRNYQNIPSELNGIYLIKFDFLNRDTLKNLMNGEETALRDYVRDNSDKLFIAPETSSPASGLLKPRASSPTENGNVAGTDAV